MALPPTAHKPNKTGKHDAMAIQRYHPALVLLHWVSALLLILALGTGSLWLAELPNSDPGKIGALRAHMLVGALILALTLARLVARAKTAHPPQAPTGMAWADRLAPGFHWALYALVLVMVGSGIGISVAFGLPAVLFAGQGTLPPDFQAAAARSVHGLASKLLVLFILLHVLAWLYHQFVRRDRLLSRMVLGRRDGS